MAKGASVFLLISSALLMLYNYIKHFLKTDVPDQLSGYFHLTTFGTERGNKWRKWGERGKETQKKALLYKTSWTKWREKKGEKMHIDKSQGGVVLSFRKLSIAIKTGGAREKPIFSTWSVRSTRLTRFQIRSFRTYPGMTELPWLGFLRHLVREWQVMWHCY